MDPIHVGSVLDRARGALLWCHRRCCAAVGRNARLLGVMTLCPCVVPLCVDQLHAGAVASSNKAGVRVYRLEADRLRTKGLTRRTALEGQPGAVNDVHRARVLPTACPINVELEGQRVAIHQAHIHVVAAGHLAGDVRIARCPNAAEGGLKLGVNGRRAVRVVCRGAAAHDAALAGTPAAAKTAVVPVLIARHLRPVAHRCEAVEGGKVVGLHRRDLDVLRVWADPAASTLVRNPHGLAGTQVPDAQAPAPRRGGRRAGEVRGRDARKQQPHRQVPCARNHSVGQPLPKI
mmetsp:Transcript_103741/g.293244  ORF Transcript_103741/g.293244 Transcript_103741/m.293244 type:complete len:290 (+) Transcript_103741:1307-2176(+)